MAKLKTSQITHVEGQCPNPECGGTNLEYEDYKMYNGVLSRDFVCGNCGTRGFESYSIAYVETVGEI